MGCGEPNPSACPCDLLPADISTHPASHPCYLPCMLACLSACPFAVYTVHIGRQPHCSCPDFAKGNVCKHQLFVMLRVLGLPPTEPLVWQAALLSHEVDEVSGS